MKRIKSNDPCPCGSNKKYKKCCKPKGEHSTSNVTTLNPKLQKKLQQATHFYASRNYAQAGILLREILSEQPNSYPTLLLFGQVATMVGDFDTVIMALSRAININGIDANCFSLLGYAFIRKNDSENALRYLGKALSIDPTHKLARTNRATCLTNSGRIEDAIKEYRHIIEEDQLYYPAWMNYLLDINGIQNASNQQVFDAHKRFGETIEPNKYAYNDWGNRNHNPSKYLKVGYLSSDFRTHSVAYFVESVLKIRDISQVETYCYHAGNYSDAMTERLKKLACHWRDVSELSDAKVAEKIHMDNIDILVELNGHTSGSRIRTLTFKPAPVQVTWLGYPNTTGLNSVDYRLTDDITDPEGDSDRYYTEQLVRLPDGFLCYTPPANAPEISELPATCNGYITYGSFNSARKITNTVLSTWTSILKRTPNSRLLLKNPALKSNATRHWIENHFRHNGVKQERIILLDIDATTEEHLNRYSLVDIGLDTFPYNGTTTTCEAVYMGVPVITLHGDNHRSRVGASLLHSIGIDELITTTRKNYINLACDLADNIYSINEYRSSLRQLMQKSALCNASAFTTKLHQAYRTMWENWCAQLNETTV